MSLVLTCSARRLPSSGSTAPRGRRLALGLDMLRKERLCQLAKRRRPPHQGPVGRWITAMRDCPQVLFGDPAGAVRGDLANPFKRQTPCGSLATLAGPVLQHVGHGPRALDPDAESGQLAVPDEIVLPVAFGLSTSRFVMCIFRSPEPRKGTTG